MEKLIENEVYFLSIPKEKWDNVFRSRGGTHIKTKVRTQIQEFVNEDTTRSSDWQLSKDEYVDLCRLATPEERAWLEACEKANKWLPMPKPKLYEIF